MLQHLKIEFDMPIGYKAELYKKSKDLQHSSTLVISLASDMNFSLYNYILNFDTFYIACDPKLFYLKSIEIISETIKKIITNHSYTKVIFLGTSKGGFAGMLYGVLLAKCLPHINFYSLCFSPQSLLYPKNDYFIKNFVNPIEYLTFLEYIKQDKEVMENSQLYGNLKEILKEKILNLKIYIVAGNRDKADSHEAQNLTHCPNVNTYFINLSSHFSLIPFTLKPDKIKDNKIFLKYLLISIPKIFELENNEKFLKKIATEIKDLIEHGNLHQLNEIFELIANYNEFSLFTDSQNKEISRGGVARNFANCYALAAVA